MRRWLGSALVVLNVVQYSLLPQRVGEGVQVQTQSAVEGEKRRFRITFYCSCSKCTGKSSPQRGGKGLTRLGNVPIAFHTAATGDPSLLGRWVHFDDLGHWVYLNDTGSKVKRNQVDLFVGGPEMHHRALQMGVQEWVGEVR